MNVNIKAGFITAAVLTYTSLCIFNTSLLWGLLVIPGAAIVYFIFNVIKQILVQNTNGE